MKKIFFTSLFILFASACDQGDIPIVDSGDSSGLDISALSVTDSVTESYSTEELLGKTPEEYIEFSEQKSANDPANTKNQKDKPVVIKNGFLQIDWEALIAPGYDANSILKRYQPQIENIQDGSDDAMALYQKMQNELDNAPANKEMANRKVSIPGFIAPLEQQNGIITEFLLVPYFGACIHSPPPPANQTVYVKAAGDYGIKLEDSYNPIWVSGEILIDGKATDIGSASYQIQKAVISPYTY